MRNGQTPIHIQRWAPADFHADETVKLLKARRDYLTLTFYRTFLDESFMAGGDLPAESEALAAIVMMPKSHVEKALSFLLGRVIFEEGGRLYQARVRRDVIEELEFREVQRINGKKGGRKASLTQAEGKPNPMGNPPEKASLSPPAPIASAIRQSPAPKRAEIPPGIPADASPAVLIFRAQGKVGTWELKQSQIDEWQKDYPGLDVLACCRKARAWSEANPEKRKSASGTPKFLVNWLNREADSGRSGGNGAKPHATSGTRSSYPIDPETLAALQERERKARARASEGNDSTTAH